MGKLKEAIEQYQKALEIEPKAIEVMYGIGRAYEHMNELSAADEWYIRTIDQRGTHEARELAKEGRTRIANTEMKSSGLRMDAVMYCLAALQLYDKVDDLKPIVADIALLGQRGLDIHSPEKKYRLKSLEGEFSGMQLLCYMFVGFKIIDPSIDGGIDLQEEYNHALAMHRGGSK